jgi:hypothetical protein
MKVNLNTRVFQSTVIITINVICILLALNLLSNNFGIAFPALLHFIAIFLLFGVIFLNLPLQVTIHTLGKKTSHPMKLITGLILLIGAFLLLIFSSNQVLWISSIALLISGLDLILQAVDRKRKELSLLAVASFGYAVVFLLFQTIPLFWYIHQQCSLQVSHTIGIITGKPLLLGPTTSGLGIFLVFLVFLLSSFLLQTKKTRKEITWFTVCCGGLFFVWILYLAILGFVSFASNNDTINLHPLLFLFCLIPTFGYLLRYQFKETRTDTMYWIGDYKKILKNGAVWAVVLLFLSVSLMTIFVSSGAPPLEQGTVLFYGEHMLGAWDVPEYGKYGKDAVGMFGLWPVYLTTQGYETEVLVENKTMFLEMIQMPNTNITRYLNLTEYSTIIESQKITKQLLETVSIFVVTNLNVSFSSEEQTIIWEFVDGGGSLLVLGDHTNVGGIEGPLNELLTPVGISFRFDAALPLDEKFKWLACTQLFHHPVTLPLTSLDELQYGVGASLNITTSSFPVIIGTYALSDQGNTSNEDIAYLGDYEYNKGEQLGDLILVAGAYYGDGKVLVFGDTSSFQNPAIAFSYPFIQSTFNWLASKQTATINTLQIGASMLFLIGAIIVYRFSKNKTILFAIFPALFCAALLLSTSLNPLLINNNTLSGNIVSIDASHGERFTLESFTDESVNGLIVNLHRNNFLPILLRDFSKEKISASNILIFIAPTSGFTSEEVTFLKQYMTNGGFIVLATGYDDKEASLPLLQAFDVDVEQIPLGPVPYVEGNTTLYQNEPRFVDSWSLSFAVNQTISYYNFTWGDFTYHLVVLIKYGAGGLLVIGDSQYLLDKNIESIYDYWPGNILFLKYLINEIQAMEEMR